MATTIQISSGLKMALSKMKFAESETYEEVIWDLVEDRMELSEETKKNIEESRKQIAKGETYTLEEAKKMLRIK